MIFFARFPAWMLWWTALIALVLPLGLKVKFEVILVLGFMVWIGALDWGSSKRGLGDEFKEE
jgi:uncharacterized protein YhhL (DUF1145 family)